MDYEKKYKEALEKAKAWCDCEHATTDDKILLKRIFPELKESGDERIRKELIEYHKAQAFLDGKPNNKHVKYVTWLEKQGDKSDIGISSTTKKKLKDNLNKALQKETGDSWNEFLDEQKPIIVPKFKVGDKVVHKGTGKPWTVHWYIKEDNAYSVEDSEGLINIYSPDVLELVEQKPNPCDGCINRKGCINCENGELRETEHKPTDKVEPKFKVGDTIYYNSFGKVKSMIVSNVVTDSTDNPMYEDANGDAVFEKNLVEQAPAWSEEDEKKIMWLVRLISTAGFRELDNDKMPCSRIELLKWLKSLRPQSKTYMNEAGEKLRRELVNYLECQVREEPTRKEKLNSWIAWVQKHSFSEWTIEEKENWNKRLDRIIDILDYAADKGRISDSDCDDYTIMLQSLRPQSQWKPSDEQITWLYRAADDANKDSRMKQILNELLSDLKKLKG